MKLSTPIEQIKRITPPYRKRLKKLGITTTRDLLLHFPFRYDDFSKISPIAEIELNKLVTIYGKILEIKNTRTWKKRMMLTEALVEDKSGAIKVVWFNQPFLIRNLKKGGAVMLSGKITFGQKSLFLSNPAYEILKPGKTLTHTGRLVPVYPETEGISSRWLRFIIKQLLPLKTNLIEPLPEEILSQHNFPEIRKAVSDIHFPKTKKLAEKARQRFAFEELFLIQLAVLREKLKLAQEKAPSIDLNLEAIKDFVSSLPYQLTNAQRKSAWEILQDLKKPTPMNRLLEGDVGSGKTVVAAIVSLNAVKSNFQVAFMAPTEILAQQHFKEMSKLLQRFKLSIALLTGKQDCINTKKLANETLEISRQKILEKTQKGEIDILIGTHALIQDKVKFGNLGLIIVDEQHRFGVKQRAKLSCSATKMIPHFLSMTATPIPRTLALTIYGDLDLSLIDEMPKGRKKIITKIVTPANRQKTYSFIKEEVKKGHQAFVICPLIEESEALQVAAATKEYEKLAQDVFPSLKLGLLHGKLKTREKEKVMQNFKKKNVDILIATPVVEVGIDVPNATAMIIEGVDRFGLAQLHQFRGRIGRGEAQSHCFLFTESSAKKTHLRLKALLDSKNSFELAEKDLQIRGPGNFCGSRQWGIPDIAMASLSNLKLIQTTKKEAQTLLRKDPELTNYPLLQEKLKAFRERIHLE